MSDTRIEFEGLEEVLDSLGNLLSEEKVRKGLGKACAVVERAAKIKAPKGKGSGGGQGLRASITSKVEGYTGIVFTPLFYAPYVEYGTGIFAEEGGRQDVPWCYQDEEGKWHTTSGMPPHPYMRPALDENRERIKQILKEGFMNDD